MTDWTTLAANIVGAVIMAALTAVLGAGGYWYYQQSGSDEIDAATLCMKDKELVHHTIFAVDQTDSFSALHYEKLVHQVMAAARTIPAFGKFTVLVLDPANPYEPKQLFSKCAPRQGREVSDLDGNPRLVERRWKKVFGTPLLKALKPLEVSSDEPSSPIVETLRGLVWRSDFDGNVEDRELILFSDMMQNTRSLSQYGTVEPFDKFEKSTHGKTHVPNLSGVSLTVLLLERPDTLSLQGNAHREFWSDYFRTAGAIVTSWPGVSGASEGGTNR